jgi:uncharacterized protein DUF87/type IV secretory system conjugative DNA transfer VirD4/TraG family protein
MNSTEFFVAEPLPDSVDSRTRAVVEIRGLPLKGQRTDTPALDALIECGDVLTIAIANESACNAYGGSRLRIGLQRSGNDHDLEQVLRAGLPRFSVVTADACDLNLSGGTPLRAPAIEIRTPSPAGFRAQQSTTLTLAAPMDGQILRRVLSAIDMTNDPLQMTIRLGVQPAPALNMNNWGHLDDRARDVLSRYIDAWRVRAVACAPEWFIQGATPRHHSAIERLLCTGVNTERHPQAPTIAPASFILTLLPDAEDIDRGYQRVRHLRPHRARDRSGSVLGHAYGSAAVPLVLDEERRTHHCFIAGGSGTGKSTVMLRLLLEDVGKPHTSVCLIDPHGDLYEDVLDRLPDHRLQDLILLDASDTEFVPALNILDTQGNSDPYVQDLIADELLAVVGKLYDLNLVGGPMFERYVRNAIRLVMETVESPTLQDVVEIFEDRARLEACLERASNPRLERFWRGIALRATGDTAFANMAAYITGKLTRFTDAPRTADIVCARQTKFNMGSAISSGKVVLAKLPVGILGDAAVRLLTTVLLNSIRLAALRRTLTHGSRPPCRVYLDEASYGISHALDSLLCEGRKYNIGVTLSVQTLHQLSDSRQSLLETVLSNCATHLIFRMNGPDAERVARWLEPDLTVQDVQELPDYVAAIRSCEHGVPRVRVVSTLPNPPSRGQRDRTLLRALAQIPYSVRREGCLAEVP